MAPIVEVPEWDEDDPDEPIEVDVEHAVPEVILLDAEDDDEPDWARDDAPGWRPL